MTERCMLDPAQGFNPSHPNVSALVRLVFAWSFVWSIGANIDDETRPKMEKWVCKSFRSFVGSGSLFLKVKQENPGIIGRLFVRLHRCCLLTPHKSSELIVLPRGTFVRGGQSPARAYISAA